MSAEALRPFEPRPIRGPVLREHAGWRLKNYAITLAGETLDQPAFEAGIRLALAALPDPPATAERPGVGLLVCHQGRGAAYVVLAWWDRENELPIRVFVREADGAGWRAARDGESVCVWDLEILWLERNAYVETVLGGGARRAAVEAYLGRGPAAGLEPDPSSPGRMP